MYRRAEEFRYVKFFVYTVVKASRLGSRHTETLLLRSESCPEGALLLRPESAQPSAAYQDKLGWTLSTEVRVRRRGHSTHTGERREERGERDIWKIA